MKLFSINENLICWSLKKHNFNEEGKNKQHSEAPSHSYTACFLVEMHRPIDCKESITARS
jgi:hypothetical protein